MIRPMRAEDRDVFIGLAHDFYHSEAVLHAVPDGHHEKTFEQIVSDSPYADGFIIEYEGKPAGYALTAITWSNEAGGLVAWLEELSIIPAFQGKGLGSEFFAYIHKHYQGKISRMRLEVARENTGAIQLYERLGFEEFDYYQMVKEL